MTSAGTRLLEVLVERVVLLCGRPQHVVVDAYNDRDQRQSRSLETCKKQPFQYPDTNQNVSHEVFLTEWKECTRRETCFDVFSLVPLHTRLAVVRAVIRAYGYHHHFYVEERCVHQPLLEPLQLLMKEELIMELDHYLV
jgi:hypothetical protein